MLHMQVSGHVTYNGRQLSEFAVHRTVAFMEQQDIHIPHMSVRETLNFAARCQGVGTSAGTLPCFPIYTPPFHSNPEVYFLGLGRIFQEGDLWHADR